MYIRTPAKSAIIAADSLKEILGEILRCYVICTFPVTRPVLNVHICPIRDLAVQVHTLFPRSRQCLHCKHTSICEKKPKFKFSLPSRKCG
ncbi:hypothetical protein Plhal304r1_c032g0103321 [Plasmopara halstedii]